MAHKLLQPHDCCCHEQFNTCRSEDYHGCLHRLLEGGNLKFMLKCGSKCWLQAVIEKASIDEVYIDVTALVDEELQVRCSFTGSLPQRLDWQLVQIALMLAVACIAGLQGSARTQCQCVQHSRSSGCCDPHVTHCQLADCCSPYASHGCKVFLQVLAKPGVSSTGASCCRGRRATKVRPEGWHRGAAWLCLGQRCGWGPS